MNRKFGQKNPGYIFNQTPLSSFVHTKFANDPQTLFIAIDLLNTKIHTATLYYSYKKSYSVFSEAISHCTIRVLSNCTSPVGSRSLPGKSRSKRGEKTGVVLADKVYIESYLT